MQIIAIFGGGLTFLAQRGNAKFTEINITNLTNL